RVDAVGAEVALRRRVGVVVDIDGVVGAGLQAALAADAVVTVEVDDAVVPGEQRAGRADLDAGRVGAVVAPHHREVAGGVGERTAVDVLDPGTELADRHLVLRLARDGAGVAPDAGALV